MDEDYEEDFPPLTPATDVKQEVDLNEIDNTPIKTRVEVGSSSATTLYIPTFLSLSLQSQSYVPATRTTLCDIVCTTNTYMYESIAPDPPAAERQLYVTLPYTKESSLSMLTNDSKTTRYQKLKLEDIKLRRTFELRKDREAFLWKLHQEKSDKERRLYRAAVQIQAVFRGFRVRPRNYSYIPRTKKKENLGQNELHDELCAIANRINLAPIPGLSLESRSKASRRKLKIENAAAFRIQRFFKMILYRSMALIVVRKKKHELFDTCARVITRSIAAMKQKKFIKRVEIIKKDRSIIKLQCCFRRYKAMLRFVAYCYDYFKMIV